MGMSAHYYAYAQDVIEEIKNGGGDDARALDEYCKVLSEIKVRENLS